MKRIFSLALALGLLLLIGGCAKYGSPPDIISKTMEDFDLEAARTMVYDLEEPVRSLRAGGIVTRDEINELKNEYELFSDLDGPYSSILYTFFDLAEIQDTSKEEFEILGNTRYPTIFDENIELAKAYIETTVYDTSHYTDATDTRTILHIEQRYVGDGDELSGFDRGYLFEPDGEGGWTLTGFSGTVNLLADLEQL